LRYDAARKHQREAVTRKQINIDDLDRFRGDVQAA
jgi:hypothetical protein